MTDYKPIAETNRFIVLDQYSKEWKAADSYQSENDLERELVQDLINQGYEFLPGLTTPGALLANVRDQLQALNKVQFADGEWLRFVETFLDKPETLSFNSLIAPDFRSTSCFGGIFYPSPITSFSPKAPMAETILGNLDL